MTSRNRFDLLALVDRQQETPWIVQGVTGLSPVALWLLLFAQNQIQRPATFYMLSRLSAVLQEGFVVASGVLQRIGKNGHPIKGFLFGNAFCQQEDGGCAPTAVYRENPECGSPK
jgi:hypothetical protein